MGPESLWCGGVRFVCLGCGGLGLDNNMNCPSGYECNLDTHTCVESICTEDNMCEGYDEVCNEAHDNCYYCGGTDCGALGCCPGKISNQPIMQQLKGYLSGCHDTALNCKQGEICNLDTHRCEEMDECQTDEDCNTDVSGVCDVGSAIYSECFYCSKNANGNKCEPGK